MIRAAPRYRITYSNGHVGQAWTWGTTLGIIRRTTLYRKHCGDWPISVERA